MNYYQARQRQSDQRWDFTVMNDGATRAVGYCAGYIHWTPERLVWLPEDARAEQAGRYNAEQAPYRDKYHQDGHATREEAERCWYGYELDQARAVPHPDEQRRCAVCQAWTTLAFSTPEGDKAADLCATHCNRDGLAAAYPFRPGITIWSSS